MKNVGSMLPVSVYPHLEQFLGYSGSRRFVVFCAAETGQIAFHDGSGDGRCPAENWQAFSGHPQVAPLLTMAHLGDSDEAYCLLLDREKRQLYSFQKGTAEALLESDKNRPVASEKILVEKLEGLFSMKGNWEIGEKRESATGTREHFAAWMAINGHSQ